MVASSTCQWYIDEVNNPDNDSPELIEPLGHDRPGIGEYN